MEKDDKGSTMIRMGVSGWMFLLYRPTWVVLDKRLLNGCVCCWCACCNFLYACILCIIFICTYCWQLCIYTVANIVIIARHALLCCLYFDSAALNWAITCCFVRGQQIYTLCSYKQEALLLQTFHTTPYVSQIIVNCCTTVWTSCTTNPEQIKTLVMELEHYGWLTCSKQPRHVNRHGYGQPAWPSSGRVLLTTQSTCSGEIF